jgi:hypothetical protein
MVRKKIASLGSGIQDGDVKPRHLAAINIPIAGQLPSDQDLEKFNWVSAGGGGSLVCETNDKTAEREQNVIYQNTSGKLMFLAISVYIEPFIGEIAYLTIGDTSPPTIFAAQVQVEGGTSIAVSQMLCFFIKPNQYYRLFTGNGEIPPEYPVTIAMWFEQLLSLA